MSSEFAPLDRAGVTEEETEIVEAMTAQLRRFAAERIDPLEIDENHHIPLEIIEDLGELGWFSPSIPTEYGGAGLSMQGVCSLCSAMAGVDRSVATTIGLHLGLGTRGIIRYGSESLKEHLLPRMASGEWVASFCATEPKAGSDLTAISTKVVADGDELVVNGAKAYVTNSGFSTILTMLVQSPGLGGARHGHSLIYVRPDDEGFSTGAEEVKLGLRGSSTRTVFLDDVRIPADRVIGEPGRGMDQSHHILGWGRTAMASGCVGAAQAAFDRTLDHVRVRKQFGKPLARLPVVRDQLATMSAHLFAMKALVNYTAHVADDDEQLVARSTAAKVICSDSNWEITDMGVQLHGGSGFIEETQMPLLLRDARITRIFEGANDVLRLHAGGMEATRPRPRESIADRFDGHALGVAADEFAATVRELRDHLEDEHGLRLLRNHRLMHRLGSAVVLREATDAAVLRGLAADRDSARANARRWLTIAEERLHACLSDGDTDEVVDAIVDARAGVDF